MKRVGVILSGCGVQDGSEIHEAVLTLLALDRAGAQAICVAPNENQPDVINHLTGELLPGERRNMLLESARIARGKIKSIATVQPTDFDALILPGGFGAVKNLCDFALKGPECTVHPEVARLVKGVHAAGKPIGAICIAPAIVAKLLGGEGVEVTIGNDPQTASKIEAFGASHHECAVREIHIDRKRKVVSTPAYMLAGRISEAADGIERCVKELLAMVQTV